MKPEVQAAVTAIQHGAQEVQVPAGWSAEKFTQNLLHALLKVTGRRYRLVNAQKEQPAILVMEGVK